jgi:hypothetical protein
MGGNTRIVLKIGSDEFNTMIDGCGFNSEIDGVTGMETNTGAPGGLFKGSLLEMHIRDTLSTAAAG